MHHHDQYRAFLSSYFFAVPVHIAECLVDDLYPASATTPHPPLRLYRCSYSDRKLPRPLSCGSLVSSTVGLIDMSDFRDERIVRVGIGKHGANG
jgi:hypothetical protein